MQIFLCRPKYTVYHYSDEKKVYTKLMTMMIDDSSMSFRSLGLYQFSTELI